MKVNFFFVFRAGASVPLPLAASPPTATVLLQISWLRPWFGIFDTHQCGIVYMPYIVHWLSLASPSRRCLENTLDSDPQLALIHAMPSRSPISITWKSVEGGARILARVVVTTRYICPGLPRRSRSYLNRFSLFAVVNVQATCLSLWLLKLGNWYSCSHARAFQSAHLPI